MTDELVVIGRKRGAAAPPLAALLSARPPIGGANVRASDQLDAVRRQNSATPSNLSCTERPIDVCYQNSRCFDTSLPAFGKKEKKKRNDDGLMGSGTCIYWRIGLLIVPSHSIHLTAWDPLAPIVSLTGGA